MKKSVNITEKKAREEYFTNLMLVNTVEGMGVLILLTVLFKFMNSVNEIFWMMLHPSIITLFILSVAATGFFAFSYFKNDETRMLPNMAFSAFMSIIWGIMFYGFSSPHSLVCFKIICYLSVIYFIGAYVAIYLASRRKVKI